MSDDDLPKHKYVDGVLVELTKDEIAAIMKERAAAQAQEKEGDDAPSRSKRK